MDRTLTLAATVLALQSAGAFDAPRAFRRSTATTPDKFTSGTSLRYSDSERHVTYVRFQKEREALVEDETAVLVEGDVDGHPTEVPIPPSVMGTERVVPGASSNNQLTDMDTKERRDRLRMWVEALDKEGRGPWDGINRGVRF